MLQPIAGIRDPRIGEIAGEVGNEIETRCREVHLARDGFKLGEHRAHQLGMKSMRDLEPGRADPLLLERLQQVLDRRLRA